MQLTLGSERGRLCLVVPQQASAINPRAGVLSLAIISAIVPNWSRPPRSTGRGHRGSRFKSRAEMGTTGSLLSRCRPLLEFLTGNQRLASRQRRSSPLHALRRGRISFAPVAYASLDRPVNCAHPPSERWLLNMGTADSATSLRRGLNISILHGRPQSPNRPATVRALLICQIVDRCIR